MKAVVTIVCALAIANVLAIGGAVAWLRMSDRLNMARVQLVRETFSRTITEEAKGTSDKHAAEEQERASAAEAERIAAPPVTAAETIESQRREEDQQLQVLQRKQREIESLRAALATQLSAIEQRERALESAKAAFERARGEAGKLDADRQFQQALATLEGQKPRDAKQVLRALIDTGAREQAVSYLSKMEDGKRTKVLAEFVKEDPGLAAGLLESVRTRNLPTSESTPDAEPRRTTVPAAGDTGAEPSRR